jgi:hypothetical protein
MLSDMPDIPPWAARASLYVVVGAFTIFVIPLLGWVGKRQVESWESQLETIKEENDRLRKELEEVKQKLSGEHDDTKALLQKVHDEVSE